MPNVPSDLEVIWKGVVSFSLIHIPVRLYVLRRIESKVKAGKTKTLIAATAASRRHRA